MKVRDDSDLTILSSRLNDAVSDKNVRDDSDLTILSSGKTRIYTYGSVRDDSDLTILSSEHFNLKNRYKLEMILI